MKRDINFMSKNYQLYPKFKNQCKYCGIAVYNLKEHQEIKHGVKI